MAIESGSRLGAYEVVSRIGAGGMGEVYSARDTRLKREVALKVLPDAVAADPDRLARFQREAEVLASLNHPHIAAIYGVEESVDAAGRPVRGLVMELVQGQTLADRLADGPLPVDEALAIARQIADALDAAHEQGIIHRDLKPANIAIRADGTVKVLDFGLAKALDPSPSAGGGVTMSPTISLHATQAGIILGSAAYMSPEQARGKTVDQRVDIWAFGCVLFEMLTGRRAFDAEDVSLTLAEVMKGDPDFGTLPADTPAHVRQVIRLCLQKNPQQRIADIRDVRLALDGAFAPVAPPVSAAPAQPIWRRLVPVAAAAVVAAALVGGAAWRVWPSPEMPVVTRFAHTLPDDQEFRNTGRPIVGISPDGDSVLYNAVGGIYVRALGEIEPRRVAGTENAVTSPVFSPDGEWIAYFQGTELRKISIGGGTPVIVSQAENPFGISWERDNTILFGQPKGILRVSADGGAPQLVVEAAAGEAIYGPRLLPGGDAVIFTVTTAIGGNRWDQGAVVAEPLGGGERTVLVRGGSDARYIDPGYLIYASGDALFAVRFDLDALRIIGGPVPLVDGFTSATGRETTTGAANYDISDNGTLVYARGGTLDVGQLVWVDRTGAARPASDRTGGFRTPRIAPDGTRVAVEMRNADGNPDVWVVDTQRGTFTRLTTDASSDGLPLWTPDGKRIVFSSNNSGGASALHWVAADGSGAAEPLTKATTNQGATSWLPDGSALAFYDVGAAYDIFMVKPGAAPVPLIQTPFVDRGPAFSPDGKWLAYSSNETGRSEIYVTPYPGPGGKIAISTGGGRSPRWAANGRELIFRNGRQMVAVPVDIGLTFRAGTPRVLFEGEYAPETEALGAHNYDVSADGQRFLMIAPRAADPRDRRRPQIVVTANWMSEVERRLPASH